MTDKFSLLSNKINFPIHHDNNIYIYIYIYNRMQRLQSVIVTINIMNVFQCECVIT